MFGKKSVIDPKKSAQKFLDQKKDSVARLKHLKSVVDNVDVTEAKALFESSYSSVYNVFYDQFINIEANLRQRVHRGSREDFDVVLMIFDKILTLLPELISRKWQCHSIGRLLKKLLHPGNTLKLRREAMRLFLLWYQILGENAPCELHWIFACQVPGFFLRTDNGVITLESIISGAAYHNSYHLEAATECEQVTPLEVLPILPVHPGEKQPEDESQFFLECLLDYMVTQVHKIVWKDRTTIRQQKCFQFLFDSFKKYYISNIFEDFNWNTNIYMPCLDLPEWNSSCFSDDKTVNEPTEITPKMCLIPFKVVIIRWFSVFLNKVYSTSDSAAKSHASSQSQDHEDVKEARNNFMSNEGIAERHQSPNNASGAVIEKDINIKTQTITGLDHSVVMQILYSSRDNINMIHEVFRQAFLLPWTEAQTMRRVIAVYRDWIITGKETPPFMFEPDDIQRDDKCPHKYQSASTVGMDDSLPREGSPYQIWRSKTDSHQIITEKSAGVRAGLQKSLQVVITHTSNVFLQMVEAGNSDLLDEQVDMCKRVLNIYRYIVMNINLEQKTWEQLLVILLHITSKTLPSVPPLKKNETLGGRLSPALFQTLIVTWIKANLNVSISLDLWDQFRDTLSSLTLWKELIMEWAKTMETLNRVLARLVYGLDLNDLPLERLSEQKQKKRRGRLPPSESYAPKAPGKISQYGLESSQLSNDTALGVKLHSQNSTESKITERFITRNATHFSTGDGLAKAMSRSSRSFKGLPISRSASDGCMIPQRIMFPSKSSKEICLGPYEYSQGFMPFSGQDIKKSACTYNESSKVTSSPKTNVGMRKSRSMESVVYCRASTPSSFSDASVDGTSRSPSPSLSTGIESNSIKDSPMQIDVVTAENSCSSDIWESSQEEPCSIMAGGKKKGWLPDVAVAMWRRMLGVLGDINKISDPEMHALVFQYLVEMFETLVKLRENQGVTTDNQSTPDPPELIPPLNIISPWLFKAVALPSKYKKGRVSSYRLLCTLTLRLLEEELPEDYLVQFYSALHLGLCGSDLDIISTVVKYCGPQIFSLRLPGATMLMWDFIHAAESIIAAPDLSLVPASEAVSILGALVCIPNITPVIPVLNSSSLELTYIDHKVIRDYIINLLLRCGLLEHHGEAQCISLCSLGIYLYEDLLIGTSLEKVIAVIDVLLKNIMIFKENVGKVACDVLCLLIDHVDELMKTFPRVPKMILKSTTTALQCILNNETIGKELECDHLVVSLIFCLGEWCMHVPHKELMDYSGNDEPLLLSAFSVLCRAAFNIQMPSNKQSTIVSQFPQADKDIPENNCDDGKDSSLPSTDSLFDKNGSQSSEQYFPQSSAALYCHLKDDSDPLNIIKLAAKMMLSHLNNHLGHFPMGIGATRITSMVNENDDIPGLNDDDLSAKTFNSPHVQFFMLNNNTLISFVELPVLNVPGGGITAGTVTAKSQVRVILRDMVGKYSWDCSILFGTNESCSDIKCKGEFQDSTLHSMADHSQARLLNEIYNPLLTMRRSQGDFLPTFDEFPHNGDNLNDLLKYIGNASPECLMYSGKTLNIPQEMFAKFGPDIQEDIMTTVLNQRNYELDYIHRVKNESCMLGRPAEPCSPPDHHTPFQYCRLLINQIGLMSWEKRPHLELLKKNEKLLRELRNIDNQKCRETHKIAVIYVADGQEDKNSVLMNAGGGQAYEEFVAGLAWEVELYTHNGFFGGLQANGTTGDTAPYFATSLKEVIFHVATRMPTHNEESKIQKLRHLGNDEVHVVWSEHQRDYRRGIITTEFGDVLIVIYPLLNQLYRIQISRKPGVPFFGPLFDGAIVPGRILSGLVRATSINASRATRTAMPIFQHFYKERMKALESIIKNHKDLSTFEDFAIDVVLPSCTKKDTGLFSGLNGKLDGKNVLTLSNLAAALLDTQNLPSLSTVNNHFISLPEGASDSENQY